MSEGKSLKKKPVDCKLYYHSNHEKLEIKIIRDEIQI